MSTKGVVGVRGLPAAISGILHNPIINSLSTDDVNNANQKPRKKISSNIICDDF